MTTTSSKIAIYPGSFDPFTLGHKLIVDKGLLIFDKIIVGLGENVNKKTYFSLEKRESIIRKVYEGDPRVEVVHYDNLTADFCRDNGINFIIRGIRNVGDFEFERNVAQINQKLNPVLETVFLMTPAEYSEISSTIIRDILIHGGDPMQFMPKGIRLEDLK